MSEQLIAYKNGEVGSTIVEKYGWFNLVHGKEERDMLGPECSRCVALNATSDKETEGERNRKRAGAKGRCRIGNRCFCAIFVL